MKVAVVGCLHGELDIIYERIAELEQRENTVVDILLICGDFQAIRNINDLHCIAVPDKYKQLGTFHHYYFGEKTAPKLTLLIGGNHEASNYMQTLPYGGWVAPNMYYLGYSSVVQFGGLRIGGISGIYGKHSNHAKKGHFEGLPYNGSTMRSIYHTRETDVYKFLQLTNQHNAIVKETPKEDATNSEAKESVEIEHEKEQNGSELQPSKEPNTCPKESPPKPLALLDIFMSHDWPVNIHECGNVNYLLNKKPFFRKDIQQDGQLGNPLLGPLVPHLKPKYWFAAHLHVDFRATVTHETAECRGTTQFQALDKVLNHRSFLKIFDITPDDTESGQDKELHYDAEWLAILRKTDHLLTVDEKKLLWNVNIGNGQNDITISDEDIQEIRTLFNGDLKIPQNFAPCEPVPAVGVDNDPNRRTNYVNAQTSRLCEILSIRDPNEMLIDSNIHRRTTNSNNGNGAPEGPPIPIHNPDEIDLSDCDSEEETNETKKTKVGSDLFFIDTKGRNH